MDYVTGVSKKETVEISEILSQRLTQKKIPHPVLNAKNHAQEAEIIAVGPGGVVDGKEIKMEVKVGQKVIYSKYSGTEVKLDGEEYIILKQSDILAIVED